MTINVCLKMGQYHFHCQKIIVRHQHVIFGGYDPFPDTPILSSWADGQQYWEEAVFVPIIIANIDEYAFLIE